MGIGGISVWQLLIILVIVFMLFGTKKLRNIGGDLGKAVKDFKNVFSESESLENKKDEPASRTASTPNNESSVKQHND